MSESRSRLPWSLVSFLAGSTFALPFAVGRPVALGADFTYHGALIESQYRSLQALGRWSPYLDALGGLERFSLRPAVYGGTTYGLISFLRFVFPLGSLMAIVFATAFGCIAWGVFTASRAAGLSPTVALATSVMTVSSGTVLSTLYGRTAIAELIAWAAFSTGVGAYLAIRTAATPAATHQVALLLAAAMFFGGHPLTLVSATAITVALLAVAMVAGARPDRRDRRPALLVALGAGVTLWQWPLSIYHLALTQTPSAEVPVQTTGFVAPLGPTSAPSLVELFDPTRRSVTDAARSGIHNEVPVLALVLVVVLLVAEIWKPSRSRRLVVPSALLGLMAAIIVLPHSLRLVRLVPMLGAMQNHWRLYPYVVATLVAALVLALRSCPFHVVRWAGGTLVVIAALGFAFGQAQVWRTIVSTVRTATIADAESIDSLDPNPIYRNDARSERDPDLPILDRVDSVAEASRRPRDAEDALSVDATHDGLIAVPSALAPPFVELERGDRAVGWFEVNRQEVTGFESRQLWLVVDHRSGRRRIVVRPSSDAFVSVARIGGVVSLVGLVAIIVLVTRGTRRNRRSRRNISSPTDAPWVVAHGT